MTVVDGKLRLSLPEIALESEGFPECEVAFWVLQYNRLEEGYHGCLSERVRHVAEGHRVLVVEILLFRFRGFFKKFRR